MNPKVSQLPRVKAEQQADGTWKACAAGVRMVVYAKSEAKAKNMVKMILRDKEKDQTEDLDAPPAGRIGTKSPQALPERRPLHTGQRGDDHAGSRNSFVLRKSSAIGVINSKEL